MIPDPMDAFEVSVRQAHWPHQRTHSKAVIRVDGADPCFQMLEEKGAVVRDVLESEALVPAVAAASMTRYLANPYDIRMRVEDLVITEVEGSGRGGLAHVGETACTDSRRPLPRIRIEPSMPVGCRSKTGCSNYRSNPNLYHLRPQSREGGCTDHRTVAAHSEQVPTKAQAVAVTKQRV